MHIDAKKRASLGWRLRRARQQAQLGQTELADRLKSDQSTISRIERGQKPRGAFEQRILAFIQEKEAERDSSRVVESVAKSAELKALIARIIAEL